jgi:predicted ribosomally synthesized peptide with nif11-like leader
MDFESLTPEQQEKVKACETPKDILALAKEEGYELSDAEIEEVAGGSSWYKKPYDVHTGS